ncbi:phage tail tape measure protein [Breoghania sp.]|uniref:phage tail tape measure protein n=1 Tax=Breoghania sp. TaxID=2065378 RepID=UPI002AA933F4|nr:phage tail tape measure protein [Breoghania sp.]
MSELTASLVIQFLSKGSDNVRKKLRGILDLARTARDGVAKGVRDGLQADKIDAALKANEARVIRARGRLMDAAAMGAALFAPLRAAALFEDAFADLEKVLTAPAERLNQLRGSVLKMSREIAMSATGLTNIMAAAAQGGIPTDQLERFTAFTAKAAVAFDMAAGEIGTRFAKLRNVYRLDQEGLENLADAANHLSNNMAATASEITDFANRAAGAQRVLKLNAVEMEALGTAMVAAGVVPETAARGVSALATRLADGGNKVRSALRMAGLTYDEFMASLNEDAPAALTDLFQRLSDSPEGMKALTALIGRDFSDDFSKLLNNPDLLAQAFRLVGEAADYAGSATNEYDARASKTLGHFQVFKNLIASVAIQLGTILLPTVNEVMTSVASVVSSFADFAEANPELTAWIVKTVAALMLFGIVGRAASYALALIRGPLIQLVALFLKFDKAGKNISLVARSLRGLGRAFRAISRVGGTAFRALTRAGPAAFRTLGAAAVGAAGKVRGLVKRLGGLRNAARLGIAAGWFIPLAFEIVDDLGRTPEERLKQLSDRWEASRKFEAEVDMSAFGRAWADMKAKFNELFGLEKDEVPSEVLGRWLSKTATKLADGAYKLGAETIDNILKGLQEAWASVEAWFSEKIDALGNLLSFDIDFSWPDPPSWVRWLMERTGFVGGDGPARPSDGPGDPNAPAVPAERIPELNDYMKDRRLKGRVDQAIKAEVIDKRPPQVTVNAPITVNGVSDPRAAATAVAGELSRAVSRAKTGAMHDGGE